MKRAIALGLLLLTLALGAQAEDVHGPVLLLELPQDAQMVENVTFDGGDFIQTYQLGGGLMVQLLRYADWDMTLDLLVQSDWPGAQDAQSLSITAVDGCPAEGIALRFAEDGAQALGVTILLVRAQGQTLVYQAIYPDGDAIARDAVQTMLDTLHVLDDNAPMGDVG